MKVFAALILFLSLTSGAVADVTMPRIIADHMILQRDAAVTIWGWADDGEQVAVEFAYPLAQVDILLDESSEFGLHQVEESVDLVLVIPALPNGRLAEGDCFGEMALIDFQPRSASVKAESRCRAIEVPTKSLRLLYQHFQKHLILP